MRFGNRDEATLRHCLLSAIVSWGLIECGVYFARKITAIGSLSPCDTAIPPLIKRVNRTVIDVTHTSFAGRMIASCECRMFDAAVSPVLTRHSTKNNGRSG